VSDAWRGADVEAVRLPMEGVADSLNVSAAAAVLLYEAWRQRRPGSSAASTQSG
jgi:TrmH family RNA methyltransferase